MCIRDSVNAPGYLMINCFWVSGQYKGCGHGKALLQSAIDDARSQGKAGLVTVAAVSYTHLENLPGGKQDYRNQSILIALNIENKPVITHIINTIERLLYICQA